MINKITITGADDYTDISEMIDISLEYPMVEWGILMSPKRNGVERYPSIKWREKFTQTRIQKSAHICGDYTKNMLLGVLSDDLYDIPLIYNRVQLNFNSTRNNWNTNFFDLILIAHKHNYILQRNTNNALLINQLESLYTSKVSYLQDFSGGLGKLGEWLPPMVGCYNGYAGGLNPDNVSEEIQKMLKLTPDDIWIDVETGVRTDDRLDMDKVRKFLKNTKL
jgi:hypothetical protein